MPLILAFRNYRNIACSGNHLPTEDLPTATASAYQFYKSKSIYKIAEVRLSKLVNSKN